MAMSRAQFRRQLETGLNAVFGLAYKSKPEEWQALFNIKTSTKAYEEDGVLMGFGAAALKREGTGIAFDEGREGWTSRYVNQTYALAFSITEEMEEDGQYGSIGAKYAKALANSMRHTKEINAAAVLNYAFDSGHAGGDGKPLCASDHPLMGGGSFSNMLETPADLSETALEDALNRIVQFTDERGIPVAIDATKLVIHGNNRFNAARILRTVSRPGTADNDVNAIKALGLLNADPVTITRLTDPDAWFLLTDADDGLTWYTRVALQRGTQTDFHTGSIMYKARERYVCGWTDPRGIFGSAGSA